MLKYLIIVIHVLLLFLNYMYNEATMYNIRLNYNMTRAEAIEYMNSKAKHNIVADSIPATCIPYVQKYAENLLLVYAQELKEDLCISFNKAMVLAKEINQPLTVLAQWKE